MLAKITETSDDENDIKYDQKTLNNEEQCEIDQHDFETTNQISNLS